jgi:ATP-binding cassette, subfamily F, member 3
MLLEDFLKTVRCGCLVVSHDRMFLRSTCSQTLELARGKLTMYPGNVDAFLENARERRLNEVRTNAAILAKRRHLQEFVDRNRARASTASRARSKAKQLERLQPLDIEASENTARIRVPIVEPRSGTAVRCAHVSIGYPERTVATGVDVEFGHGSRMVVVGDNGQGKTTFLRTLVGSLEPLAGEVKWGYGTEVGVYAQHVYASLPGEDTVYEFLQRRAARDVKPQTILDVAGGFLFRGDDVNKSVSVLSGGERARLCLAGLLLGKHNVLVLDEPGNHLDVETVDALAEALNDYRGTLIFTSHDRHFIGRVATGVVEVRDGRVANYPGDYGMYMYRVHKEIDEGTRDTMTSRAKAAAPAAPAGAAEKQKKPQKVQKAAETAANRKPAPPSRNDRELRKRLSNLEQKIEKLTEEKRSLNDRLMATTDPIEAQRLYDDLTIATRRLAEAEENWLEMSERLGGQ